VRQLDALLLTSCSGGSPSSPPVSTVRRSPVMIASVLWIVAGILVVAGLLSENP
jgi:hypothetical protein